MKHIGLDEMDAAVKSLDASASKTDARLRKRLEFIRLRYKGYPVVQAADILGINRQSGYNWQKIWNEGGMESFAPRFAGGRKSKMDDAQKARLLDEIEKGPMTTQEVMKFIRGSFDIAYSEKQVHVILDKMGLRHAKPCQKDYRQPAEARSKKTPPMVWTA